MKRLTRITNGFSQTLIYWQITNRCNFNCAYCSPFLHDGSAVPQQPDLPILLSFCQSLNDLADAGRKIELNIGGGRTVGSPHHTDAFDHK